MSQTTEDPKTNSIQAAASAVDAAYDRYVRAQILLSSRRVQAAQQVLEYWQSRLGMPDPDKQVEAT